MTTATSPAYAPVRGGGRAQFDSQSPLRAELTKRVDAYMAEHREDERGGWRYVVKALIILTWAVVSYLALVFWAHDVWTAAIPALSLGLALAGIGFSVMHDGSHGAASKSWIINRLGASTVDFIGGSSFFWHHKHDVLHHTYTNIDGIDEDIDSTPFLRLAPSQAHHWYQRLQFIYFIPLLSFFVPKWFFVDDWKTWITGQIAGTRIPRPHGWDVVQILVGKAFAMTWWLVIPLLFHSPLEVLVGFIAVSATLGITLGTVFQLAHAVTGTDFYVQPEEGERLPRPFFEHQVATTADFAPHNPLVTWYVGGLNFQVEHHLFPKISNRHYPAIAKITREVCRELGVEYHCSDTVRAAFLTHIRHLIRLGKPPIKPVAAVVS